jgi:hypothetical protein
LFGLVLKTDWVEFINWGTSDISESIYFLELHAGRRTTRKWIRARSIWGHWARWSVTAGSGK